MISDAVTLERISRIVGYKLKPGNFLAASPNLPQRVAILGEANVAEQAGLDTTAKEITSAAEAGALYGYGSPIYQIMRILKPSSGGGLGGIPVIVYPQAEAAGAVAAKRTIDITGTATKTVTHTVVINGREGLEGTRYDFVVAKDDTPLEIYPKIADAINNVLAAPVIATGVPIDNDVDVEAKWKGLTSDDLDVNIEVNGDSADITYAVSSSATGAGTPALTDALDQFGEDWNTVVVNAYGEVTLDELEAFNGIPDPNSPTGQYAGIIFKPFLAFWGSLLSDKDAIATITDDAGKKTQVTNVLCPAPNSKGFSFEAAANGSVLFAVNAQNNPHLDISNQSYTDMPVPADGNIGDMSSYDNRDFLVKKGSSTVSLVNGVYTIQDLVTTYHPDGEAVPQYRYARNLMLDFNVRYGYLLLEEVNVVDKTVVSDDQTVSVDNTIKPKQWKQVVVGYFGDLASRALITDVDFSVESLEVGLGKTNPDRFETAFRYKRTGVARIASTDAEAGFSFNV